MNLFKQVVEDEKLNQNFKSIMSIQNSSARDVLTEWAEGFKDRDGKFVKEFQTTFNSSFWELYLFAVLKKFAYKSDFSKSRPDFVIPEQNFCIEATIADNPQGGLPEYIQNEINIPTDLNNFNRKSIIRLSNSILSKHKKYIESYSNLNHVKGKPFIIAVASYDQPFFFFECQRPIEAVLYKYYVDEEEWIKKESSDKQIFAQKLAKVNKDNGSLIKLGLFCEPKYSDISAVIYSSCATWGKVRALSKSLDSGVLFTALRLNMHSPKPFIYSGKKPEYSESLLDGLRVYLNPMAKHPLSPLIFRHPDVFQSYFSKTIGDWIYEQYDGQLLNRFLISTTDNSTVIKN